MKKNFLGGEEKGKRNRRNEDNRTYSDRLKSRISISKVFHCQLVLCRLFSSFEENLNGKQTTSIKDLIDSSVSFKLFFLEVHCINIEFNKLTTLCFKRTMSCDLRIKPRKAPNFLPLESSSWKERTKFIIYKYFLNLQFHLQFIPPVRQQESHYGLLSWEVQEHVQPWITQEKHY